MPFDRDDSVLTIAEEAVQVYWNDNVHELTCNVSFSLARGVRIVTAPLELDIRRPPRLDDSYRIKRKTGQMIDVLPTEIPQEITDRLTVHWQFTPRTEPVFVD